MENLEPISCKCVQHHHYVVCVCVGGLQGGAIKFLIIIKLGMTRNNGNKSTEDNCLRLITRVLQNYLLVVCRSILLNLRIRTADPQMRRAVGWVVVVAVHRKHTESQTSLLWGPNELKTQETERSWERKENSNKMNID